VRGEQRERDGKKGHVNQTHTERMEHLDGARGKGKGKKAESISINDNDKIMHQPEPCNTPTTI